MKNNRIILKKILSNKESLDILNNTAEGLNASAVITDINGGILANIGNLNLDISRPASIGR